DRCTRAGAALAAPAFLWRAVHGRHLLGCRQATRKTAPGNFFLASLECWAAVNITCVNMHVTKCV
ncbi:hypothetical protein ACWTQZ_26395, partial [Escherichia coli]